jgi:predicted neuraminidase
MRNLLLAFVFILLVGTLKVQGQKIESSYIFEPQETYVHASSLVELPNGDVLSSWFEGSGERTANDNVINGARLKRKSTDWSDKFLMADTPNHPDCNPTLFVDNNEKLFLFWIVVRANRWESSLLKFRTSENYQSKGTPKWNWQDEIILKPGDKFSKTIKSEFEKSDTPSYAWAEYANKYENMIYEASKDLKKRQMGWMTRISPIQLKSGRILLPLYSDGYNLSIVAISDDNGVTWNSSLPIVARGNIQPSLVQKSDGTIVAFMRNNGDEPGRIMISTSKDNGYTWSSVEKSNIPNPGTSVAAISLKSGNWIMAYNNIEEGRYSLVVSMSNDEGKTWKHTKVLEYDNTKKGRYAYPSVIQTRDGKIHVSYSYHVDDKKAIKHAVFTEKEILK